MRIAPYVTLGLLVSLGVAAVEARPRFLRGGTSGSGSPPGGVTQACDGGSSVCAQFQNGQTFVTWDDVGTTGAGGASTRYRVYRSTSPINSGNYTATTLIASYVFNNSAQLFGGDPDVAGGSTFTDVNRQNASLPMSKLTDVGTSLPALSGLQVYTALSSQNAYYAVVSTNTSDGSPSYIGSVGPIAESVNTVRPVKYAASGSRADNTYGQITSPAGKPVVFSAHASSRPGGAPTGSRHGDYWQWWLPPECGWQDGRATTFAVVQDNAQVYWSVGPSSLVMTNRDTIWTSDGLGTLETYHQGIGMTPNPLVGPANRMYLSTAKCLERMLAWSISHYGADANRVHWRGDSMGAWGGANTGMRATNPRFASLWLLKPVWRMDRRSALGWPGTLWDGTEPFVATVDAAPATLGWIPENVQLDDGTVWGGTGGYADMPTFIATNPGADLPVVHWSNTKDDGYSDWLSQIEATDAFQTARRGHVFVWSMGPHGWAEHGTIDCNLGTADEAVCYDMSLYGLNIPYIAFSNSSIDDNLGTGVRDSNGIYDGDYTGCINCGFKWNVTTDTSGSFNFTVDNAWMDRSPTVHPQTTLSSALGSGVTGNVNVANNSGFLPTGDDGNTFMVVGGTEIIKASTTPGSNSITISYRGQLGTTAQSHGAGATLVQIANVAIGPVGGPYSTMTTDLTVRRAQGFIKPNGTTINCTVTPNGGAGAAKSGTVTGSAGVFTLTGVTINASGATSITCS